MKADVVARLNAALAGRYTIERELGQGGMATVYLAEDLKHKRQVALKLLRPELAAALGAERFLREITTTANLRHPHILPLYDSGEVDGFLYYVMPFVEGESLRSRLDRETQLSIDDATRIAAEVADALSYAHSRGVIHRDIKPENILLENGHAIVADFGIAQAVTDSGGEKLTRTGMALGTPLYMSPEQWSGEPVDARSDLYALACVVYEMLAGSPPFSGPTAQVLMARHAIDPVPALRTARPTVTQEVADTIERALAKVPSDRFATVHAWREALLRPADRAPEISGASANSDSAEARAAEGFWVAVLPFKCAAGNADLAALSEGMSEGIVTGLSRFSYLRVIAHGSTQRFGSAAVDVRAVGKELGVRYVMEGSLRQAGTRLRVAVQVIDAITGAHLWAENYDRAFDASEIFALQDDLVPRIGSTVADRHGVLIHSMSEALRHRDPDTLSPYEAVLRGFGYAGRPDAQEHAAMRRTMERAVERAPNNANCWAMLSTVYADEYKQGFNLRPDPLGRALEAAQRAVAAAPSSQLTHLVLADAHFFRGEIAAFRNAAERAIALNAMDGATVAYMGILMAYSGDWDHGCALAEQAMLQLNPHHPGWYRFCLFFNAYRKRHYRAALDIALKLNMPSYFFTHAALAMAYGQLGERDAAARALRELLAQKPDFDAREAYVRWFGPGELLENILDGLRKAGLAVESEQELGATDETRSLVRTPLIGRENELSEARAFLARLAAGNGGVLLIGGEPGVGKTRLSTTIMDEARSQRALCVTGHCYEMEGMPPFTPFAEILDAVARLVPLRTFREVLGDAASEIARIQPSLRDTFPDIPAPLELAPDRQRRYLFNKYREYVERSCNVAPIVVLLDDLHWADDATLSLLEHIAGYAADLPLFIIGTYRDVELEVNRPFARVLESLTRQRLATRMALRRLDEAGVGALLAALGGSAPPAPLVQVIFKETEGNPFFVEEVFHHLKEEGRLFHADGAWRTDLTVDELDVPEGVRLVIGRRLERLTPACRAVLTSAAVIGSRFELAVLEALDEQTDDELLDALEAATASQLIVEHRRGREVVYGFAHELIRQTLLGTLSMPRRQRRHLKIAAAMEAALGDRAAQRASDLAYHLYQAGAAADPDLTVKMLTLAAEHAIAKAAFTEALAHCDRAATIEDVTDRMLAGHLLRVRGAAQKGLGRWPEACATLADAMDVLTRAGDPIAAAPVALDLAVLVNWAGDHDRCYQVCTSALAALSDHPSSQRGRLMAEQAVARGLLNASSFDDALHRVREARAMGQALLDGSLIGFAYYIEETLLWAFGRLDEAIGVSAEAIPRLMAPSDVQWWLDAEGFRLMALGYAGRFAELEASIGEVSRVAHALGHVGAMLCFDLASFTSSFLKSGDLPALETQAERILSTWAAVGPWGHISTPSRAVSLAERGDPQAALAFASRAREAFPSSGPFTGPLDGCELWCLALLQDADWPARYAERRHLLPGPANPRFSGEAQFAFFLVLAHVARSDLEAAAALYPVLRQILDDGWRVGPLQPVEGLVGLAAAAGGNWDVAEGHFRSALVFVDEIGDRLGKPSVQKWYAWMLLRRSALGDHDQARVLLDDAIASFRAMGMLLSLGEAEAMRQSLDG